MEPFLQIVGGPGGEEFIAATEERFVTFFLVFVRCVSLMVSAPVIGSQSIPQTVKVLAALCMAALLEAAIPAQQYVFSGLLDFVLLVAGEVLLGLMLGFIAQILFQAFAFAGEIMGQQAGFAIVTVVDPTTQQDSALVAQIMLMFGTLVFLAIDGHQILLKTLADTFWLVPPGSVLGVTALGNASREAIRPMGGAIGYPGFYEFSIKMAGPTVVALITTTLAEAVIARTVPQVNIMVLGFGIRILLGLLVMMLSMPMICFLVRSHIEDYRDYALTMTSWLRAEPGP